MVGQLHADLMNAHKSYTKSQNDNKNEDVQ